ncbi:unnamed protein product [Sympodiomycopsis kandeliae]
MASAFSAPDAAIITHHPALDENLLASTSAQSGRSIEDLYDIHSTASKIFQGAFKRVALQFPDEGLPDSVPVYWALRKAIDKCLADVDPEQEGEKARPDLYILADTSYGNCCVDVVAAQHVEADVVVHYGHACLSPTARLPVIYVFPKRDIDSKQTAKQLSEAALTGFDGWEGEQRKALVLSYDVGYAHASEEVYEHLESELNAVASGSRSLPPLILAKLDTAKNFDSRLRPPQGGRSTETGVVNGASCSKNGVHESALRSCCQGNADASEEGCCTTKAPLPIRHDGSQDVDSLVGGDGSGRQYALPPETSLEECLILYVGGESLALTNLLLRAGPTCPVISYDPQDPTRNCRREDGRTNRLLMRRYAAVQKARDASVVGLLVGTLGVQSYLPLLSHLRQLLTGRRPGERKSNSKGSGKGRKVYTISVGKLSPAKLANFQEIDIFVLLACPENSLVDAVDPTGLRSKEFYKPIVTPYEMILALDENRTWTGSYVLEMNRLAEQALQSADGNGDDGHQDGESDDDEVPHFSLVTGGLVSRTRYQSHKFRDEADRITDQSDEAAKGINSANTGSVVLRDSSGQLTRILDSASVNHLSGRTWKGLEQRLGMDQPSVLEEGRAGIAKQYAEADGTKEG